MERKRLCFSCDLKDDSRLITEYKKYHTPGNTWPEITKSIKDAGILDMQIYLTGNRMFMIMEVDDTFDPKKKAEMDANNPKVQEWERLMWKYQQALPWAKEGEKWIELKQVFQL
ncbi:MAG: L-rhamnose mutarotase [Maribacter sp.]|nr:L-rhamnose mutarotase [Maribacter sp.]